MDVPATSRRNWTISSRHTHCPDKGGAVRFLPIDRINTIIAVAPNPGAFVEVEKWLGKLDSPVKVTAGAINNYVYRVRYGDATSIACSIQALYGQLMGFGGAQN